MFLKYTIRNLLRNPFNFLLILMPVFVIFAFFVDSPAEIFYGLINIYSTPDLLITDYIRIGGMGAAFVNSAMVGIVSIVLMKFFKCENKGTNIMSIWLMVGFALFGKNLVNCAPIVLGGYIYARYQRKPFSNYLATTFLATTLSPAVSTMYYTVSSNWVGILLGLLLGAVLGFIIIPISANAYKAHGGFNLYNVGFAAGIVAMIITALLRNAGFDVAPVSLWSEGNNKILTVFLFIICVILILAGIFLSSHRIMHIVDFKNYKENYIIGDDTYTKHGEKAYLNMGILGLITTMAINLMGGDLSGPIIGGIFTIIGFGCMGKNVFNIAPSMIGCIFAAYAHGWDITSPGLLLTYLFSATLAPISSAFGPLWGILAGVLHLNISINLSEMNGGLSLYNNGLGGGLVTMVLVPVIFALQKEAKHHH